MPFRYIFYTLMFEFDPEKSRANRAKHGIDFEQAQMLWDDPDAYAVSVQAVQDPRWAMVAKQADQHWCMIFTLRGSNIRIISVRRARMNEVEAYEQRKRD